jgi:hypothetical protein
MIKNFLRDCYFSIFCSYVLHYIVTYSRLVAVRSAQASRIVYVPLEYVSTLCTLLLRLHVNSTLCTASAVAIYVDLLSFIIVRIVRCTEMQARGRAYEPAMLKTALPELRVVILIQ